MDQFVNPVLIGQEKVKEKGLQSMFKSGGGGGARS